MICSENRLLLLPLLLAIAGCTSGGKPSTPPRLGAVTPAVAYVDEDTEVILSGEAFNPRATLRWGGGVGDVSTNTTFEVFVGEQRLTKVTWVDSKTLGVVLPKGAPVGRHTVRVIDPYGVTTSLPDALEVRVRRGAVLSATLLPTSNAVRVLKEIVVHLDVTNVGDSPASSLGVIALPATGTAEVREVGTSPGKTTLAPGESTRFELTWVSMKVGEVVFSAEVRGVDARTSTSVRAGPLTTQTIQVIPPPDVTSTLTAARNVVSRGQVIELQLVANNVGAVGIEDLLPVAVPMPAGLVDLKTAPLKRDLPQGASQMFSFFFDTLAKGDVAFRVDALGVDALTNAVVAMTPAFETVTIVSPATLAVSLVPSAARVAPGQRFTLTATVTNSGDAKALAVLPTIALTGAGGLTLVSSPTAADVGTAPVAFKWEYDAASPGAVQLTVAASGADENSGVIVAAMPVGVALLIQAPAALAAAFVTPLRVNVGQFFGWSIDVANTGGSTVTAVSPGAIGILAASPGSPDGGPTPALHDIPDGATRSFSFAHTAGDAGTLRFQASPSGTDAIDATVVTAPLATSNVIQVERPARLIGALAIPSVVGPLSPFVATLQVTNAGEAVALAVVPSALTVTGSATLVAGPMPASAVLGADAGVTFTWQLTAGTSGTAQVSASAAGTDSNDGSAITTGPRTSNVAAINEVTAIADDPFADGTSFSYVFSYAGRVWLGPRKTGFGAVSMEADGTAPANHAFSFARDNGSGQHKNTSAAPYPSIGSQGCTPNTATCGPDNENGRGVFFAGSFDGGSEWLGAAGAQVNGRLNYIYLSNDTDPTIDFRYVDLAGVLGPDTHGTSAAHFFNGRLYLGFPDNGGNRPYLLALLVPPPSPGLNATRGLSPTAGVDVLEMEGEKLPGVGQNGGNTAAVQIIDTITDFNDRLYIANNGGIVRSTTNLPRGPGVAPADWVLATPTGASFTSKNSITTTKVSDLIPSDKAFPALAAFQGRLYAARNTTSGPQLWVCTPGVDGFCAPSEWALIAANGTGDVLLSQFNVPANQSIGLLAATATTLFIGFNNPAGLQLYKTTVAAPSARSDFTGSGGCVAGTAGCEGLGTNGLGTPAINRQIFDARALTFGAASWLYLVTGNGTSGMRVWRIGG